MAGSTTDPPTAALSKNANPNIRKVFENLMAKQDKGQVGNSSRKQTKPSDTFVKYVIPPRRRSSRRGRNQRGINKYKGTLTNDRPNNKSTVNSDEGKQHDSLLAPKEWKLPKQQRQPGSTYAFKTANGHAGTDTLSRQGILALKTTNGHAGTDTMLRQGIPALKTTNGHAGTDTMLRQGIPALKKYGRHTTGTYDTLSLVQHSEKGKLSLGTSSSPRSDIKSKISFFEKNSPESPSTTLSVPLKLSVKSETPKDTDEPTRETVARRSPRIDNNCTNLRPVVLDLDESLSTPVSTNKNQKQQDSDAESSSITGGEINESVTDSDEHANCVAKHKYDELLHKTEILKQKLKDQTEGNSDKHCNCIAKSKYDELMEEHEKLEQKLQDQSDCVAPEVIRRRVKYVSSVRARTVRSIKKTKEILSQVYPQLFEYALIVGVQVSDSGGYIPYVIYKYPESIDSNVSVPKFCFPDVLEYKPPLDSTIASESYSFVLTKIDGERMYGYCRRLKPPDSSLHEVLCVVSPLDAYSMYNKLLDKIEESRKESLENARHLIEASFHHNLPGPGRIVHVELQDKGGYSQIISLDHPSDNCRKNVNYECLLDYLGIGKLIMVFSSLMMERRVLLCSNSLNCLTQTSHALTSLLYPFCWQHIYIPLLPPEMIDVCAAPTPYLIGILTSHLPQVLKDEEILEEVLIVDLDKKEFVRSVGDEATLLPKKLQRFLKTAINMSKTGDESESYHRRHISDAFIRMFIQIMGHFPEHITTKDNGKKVFDEVMFCENVSSKGISQVLEWFTNTQMFDVFISSQLEMGGMTTKDLFMSRLLEYQQESRGLGKKIKRFGKSIKNRLG